MNDDVELILMRWGAWSYWTPWREIGYPRAIPTARLIPPEISDGVVPLSDEEAMQVNEAVSALCRRNRAQARVLFLYYVVGLSDGEISKRYRGFGAKGTVQKLRYAGQSYVQAFLDARVDS